MGKIKRGKTCLLTEKYFESWGFVLILRRSKLSLSSPSMGIQPSPSTSVILLWIIWKYCSLEFLLAFHIFGTTSQDFPGWRNPTGKALRLRVVVNWQGLGTVGFIGRYKQVSSLSLSLGLYHISLFTLVWFYLPYQTLADHRRKLPNPSTYALRLINRRSCRFLIQVKVLKVLDSILP